MGLRREAVNAVAAGAARYRVCAPVMIPEGELPVGNLVDFGSFGLRHAEDSLIAKLVSYGAQPALSVDFDRAAQTFWKYHEKAGLLSWDDAEGPVWDEEADFERLDALKARFHDWFLFDYRLMNGMRVVEAFGKEHLPCLNRFELQLLTYWLDSYYGVFRIRLEPDRLTLEDVLSGDAFHVTLDLEELSPEGTLMAGRPLSLGEEARLSGAVVTVVPSMAESVTGELVRKYERLRSFSPNLTVVQFYRLCGHMLDSLLEDGVLH